MKRRNLGLGLLAGLTLLTGAAVVGCSSGSGGPGGGGDAEERGTLRLPLTTEGASGTKYRLREATFQVSSSYYYYDYESAAAGAGGSGPQTITVSSEDDPDAASIALSLERGSYYVRLLPGWHMEKLEDGVASEVEANLLSEATQYLYVSPHSTTWVEYQFGLGDRALWFNGQVNIGVRVYENPNELYGGGGEGNAGGFPNNEGGFSGSP
jgi:hypothetical protein